MKDLVLDAEDVMYSHEVEDHSNSALPDLEEAILNDTWDNVPPVYVVQSDEFPGKYLIYNGNDRLHIAKMFRKPLSAKLIEGEEDLDNIPDEELAYWTRAKWQGTYDEVPTADNDYELTILKIVDSAKYCPGIPKGRPKRIFWVSRDEKRLLEILADS